MTLWKFIWNEKSNIYEYEYEYKSKLGNNITGQEIQNHKIKLNNLIIK